ncbi:1-acyl-sn-glycerol-3-phosphate acyltransferase [Cutibacterium acnes JCM 18920]|nr:1-acyl-sn-glycerol-3-phosphate acyltransferase [Cutibacterium acnes JCM 18920]
MWYEFFKYALFGPGVRALWHPRVVGEENIPTEGGDPGVQPHCGLGSHHRRVHD